MSLLKHTKAGKHRAVTLYLLSTHRCHLIWDSYSLKGSICRVQNGAEFRNEPIFSVKNRGYRLQICVAGIEPQHPLCLSVLQAEFLPALSRESMSFWGFCHVVVKTTHTETKTVIMPDRCGPRHSHEHARSWNEPIFIQHSLSMFYRQPNTVQFCASIRFFGCNPDCFPKPGAYVTHNAA